MCRPRVWEILDWAESVGLYLSSVSPLESQCSLLADSSVALIGQGERAEEGSVQPH